MPEAKDLIGSIVTLNKWVQRLMYTAQTELELVCSIEPDVVANMVESIEDATDMVKGCQITVDYEQANN